MSTDAEKATPRPKSIPVPQQRLRWEDCKEVERVAGRMSEAWVFRDSRILLYSLFENLAEGATITEIADWFEGLTVERDHPRAGAPDQDADRGSNRARILFGHGMPHALRHHLPGHKMRTAK